MIPYLKIGIISAALFVSGFSSVLAAPFGAIVPTCPATGCGWLELVKLAENILKFFIYMAVPIAAICFAYAGWLYLSARGNPSEISKAHSIFLNVAIGLIIVLVAWLVVDQLLKALLVSGSYVDVLGNIQNQ